MACLRTVLTLTLLCWACCRAELPRPLCQSDAAPLRCILLEHLGEDEYLYTVDGLYVTIKYTFHEYYGFLDLKCPEGLTLDNSALPRFESQQEVEIVNLWGCPPPRDSYAAALGKLNVVVLKMLSLHDAGDVTDTHLAGLSGLTTLELNNTNLLSSAVAALPGALGDLHVHDWHEPHPAPWGGCAVLRWIWMDRAAAEELPAGWLKGCGELTNLYVWNARNLSQLHAESLRGARKLQVLSLKSCALTSLPAGLLDDAEDLIVVDLSRNRLHEVQGEPFAMKWYLKNLDLSYNNLTTAVFGSLQSATSLIVLKLNHNIYLKDSCGDNVSEDNESEDGPGPSPLLHLTRLRELGLRNTSASKICSDWRENMYLDYLILEDNNFTSISYAELQFGHPVKVYLFNNNITTLNYTRADFKRVRRGQSSSSALVLLDEKRFRCDCDSYWAARALRERPNHLECGHQLLARCPRCLACAGHTCK